MKGFALLLYLLDPCGSPLVDDRVTFFGEKAAAVCQVVGSTMVGAEAVRYGKVYAFDCVSEVEA